MNENQRQTHFDSIMDTTKNPRVAVYLRVSGTDQSFDSQVHAVRLYCRRRGWKRIRIFHEKKPGAKAARTQFDRLMNAVRAEEFDVIVIFKLARFGRSALHLLNTIEELKSRKVPLISITEGVDTSSDDPRTKWTIYGLAQNAEFFRDNLSDNVKAGHAAARARGVRIGRPPMIPEQAAKIIRLRKKGESFRAIGKKAGVSAATACRVWDAYEKAK